MSKRDDSFDLRVLELLASGQTQVAVAKELGCPPDRVRRVIARSKVKEPKPVAVKVEVTDRAMTADEALAKLKKQTIDFDDMRGDVFTELTERGHILTVVHGRWQLVTNPHALEDTRPVTDVFRADRQWHRIMVMTDAHFGGRQAQSWFVLQALREAEKRNCDVVLNVGDTFDGAPKMHAGFEYELGLTKMDHQVDFAAEVFGTLQVPMVMIGGNHCASFFKSAGVDPCRVLAERCKPVHYIGPIQGWIAGPNDDPNFIRMFHPGDGCSYALSYKDQKTAEYLVLQNDRVPTGFHFTGHYHKYNKMQGPNGAYYFLAPASCGQTDFMKAKRLINSSGVLFLEFSLDAHGRVDRMIEEHVPLHPSQWRRENYADFLGQARKAGLAPSVWH